MHAKINKESPSALFGNLEFPKGVLVNNMYKKLSKLLKIIFVIGLFVMPISVNIHAEEDITKRTIKVAVLNNSIYAYQDENKVWRGMDVECMTNISQRVGFKVEFIDSSNDNNFLNNLNAGKYDVVADAVKIGNRENEFLFSDNLQGTTYSSLLIRKDDDRWDYGNIEQISKMRVGVIRNYANSVDFKTWCQSRKVTPTIKEYAGFDEMALALKNNEIDAELNSAMSLDSEFTNNVNVIMKILPENYYFAFRKDDVSLKNAFDEALNQILIENPYYLSNLKSKYDRQVDVGVLPLSVNEKAYIKKHPILKVGVLKNDNPYYSEKNGGKGIIFDYYSKLAERAGLKVKFVAYDNQNAVIKAVNKGEVDILGLFTNDVVTAYNSGLRLTDNYFSTELALLTKAGVDASTVKKVATVYRTTDAVNATYSNEFTNATIQEYANIEDAFKALQVNRVDAIVAALPSATWCLNQTNASAYSIAPLMRIELNYYGALRNDNKILTGIMNKMIAKTQNFSSIATKDTLQENNWETYINRIPPGIIASIASILMALIIGLAWSLFMLNRRQKERNAILLAQAENERERMQVESIKRAAEERNDFFSNISHDMRTPLNAMLGFSREARKSSISQAQREEYLKNIEYSGKLLLDLVNDTLTMSKMHSGKLDLDLKPVDTTETGNDIITPIREAAEQRQINFSVDASGYRHRIILADALNLKKIFLNLLTNAVKYTPSGGSIKVTIYDDSDEGQPENTIFIIEDTGIGISEAFLPHIFEPFAQERRKGYEATGTGLGLSIVKRLVDMMGGSIHVESKQNVGTKFTLCFHFEEVKDYQKTNDKPVSDDVDFTSLKGKKVLMCEDNHLNAQIAQIMLKDLGIECDVANDGEDGVSLFKKSKLFEYAAVLMDLRMPGVDGYEATKQIKATGRLDADKVPIIAMSADAFSDDIQKCLEAGMVDHIAKPIDPKLLAKVLKENIK